MRWAELAAAAPSLAHTATAADLFGDVSKNGQRASAIVEHSVAGPLCLRDHVLGWGMGGNSSGRVRSSAVLGEGNRGMVLGKI